MIRRCVESEFEAILAIINDAARAYEGVIPADRWRNPYMSEEELRREIDNGVVFWGYEETGALVAVMGVQDVEDMTLIRHAYVRTARRNRGIGGELLAHLVGETRSPMLIGTWAAAEWAVRFYEHRGFHVVSEEEKDRVLKRYWAIPERQIETSVVLADQRWLDARR